MSNTIVGYGIPDAVFIHGDGMRLDADNAKCSVAVR